MKKATIKNAASFFLMMVLAIGFTANSFAQYTFYGDEIIIDGDFSADTISSAWSNYFADFAGVSGSINLVDGEVAVTDIVNTDGTTWHVQFNQVLSQEQIESLVEGATYELSFDARTEADSTKELQIYFGQNGGAFANYATGVSLTGEMQTFTQDVKVEAVFDTSNAGMKLGFEMGTSDDPVYLDNVSFKRKAENVVFNGGFNANPPDSMWTAEGTNGTVSFDDGELAITDITAGNPWEIQAYQNFNEEQLDSIYVGPYVISFDARTDAEEKSFNLYFGENIDGGSWTNFAGSVNPTVTSEMKHYSFPVEVSETWSSMKIGFEVGATAASIFIDNVILERVREIPPAAPLVELTTSNGIVTVEVTAVDDATAYDVFFADSSFADTDGGALVGTIDPANGLTLEHTTAAPHPNFASDFIAYYGVVAKTESGTASEMTAASIETGMSTAKNYATELSSEAVNAVTSAFETGEIPEGSELASFFPDNYVPFQYNQNNGKDLIGTVESDEDLSAKFWVGFQAADNQLIIYSEIMDDNVVYASEATGAAGAWDYDSWEMGIGNYTPDSFIEGSTHSQGIGGAEPDWQLRGGGLTDEGSVTGFIFANGYAEDRLVDEVPNSATIIETTDTGYRTLTVLNTVNLLAGDDAAFNFPTGTEVALYPFQIAINDNDGTAREAQVGLGSKAENGDWWQRPAQWDVVAFVGSDATPVSNENDISSQIPGKFVLEQNYPNPFNPVTNINFSLPSASKVTLEVFNLLGQRVATLIQNESFSAGSHTQSFDASNLSSGLYIYRIIAGDSFTSTKKMMLIK